MVVDVGLNNCGHHWKHKNVFFDILVDVCLNGHMQQTLGKLVWIAVFAVLVYVLRF